MTREMTMMPPSLPKPPPQNTKKTFSTMNLKERENLYDTSPNTQRIEVADGHVDFVKHFKYLGSYISFDLTDDYDINKRIAAANKSMGSLKHFWNNPYASLRAKQLISLAIPANQLLWGCESWALCRSHITKLEVFWHRSIQRNLRIGIGQVIKERITNERIRKNILQCANSRKYNSNQANKLPYNSGHKNHRGIRTTH